MLEKIILSLMWVFLLVVNYPHTITIQQLAFFIALVLAVFMIQRYRQWQWPPLKYPFLLWMVVATFSLLVSDKPLYSIEMVKKEVIYYILAFWLFFIMTKNEDELIFLIYAVLASASIFVALSIYDYFLLGHSYDYMNLNDKLYGNSTDTSIFMLITAALSILALKLERIPKAFKLYALTLIPFCILLIYLARHRSGYFIIALYILFITHTTISKIFKLSSQKKILLSLVVVISIMIPTMLLISNRELAWTPGQSLSVYVNDERWTIWQYALKIISEKPFTGMGFGNKDFFVPTLRGGYYFYTHNIFLDYGVMMGLPGILAVTGLFSGLGFKLWQNLKDFKNSDKFIYKVSISGVLILVGFVVESLRDTAMRLHTGLFFWAVMGMILGSCQQGGKKWEN